MRGKTHTHRTLLLIAAVLWFGVLTLFSAQNAEDSGALSGMLLQRLFAPLLRMGLPEETLHVLLRKLAHFTGFAIEGLLLMAGLRALPLGRYRPICVALGICALMAIANELEQLLSPGRSCSVWDMLIDTSGAALGIALQCLIGRCTTHYRNTDSRKDGRR